MELHDFGGDYPLYPELGEEAKQAAQDLMDKFKSNLLKICEETIGELYCDVANYIETDSWMNFRNELLDGMRNYNNRKIHAQYDFEKIRQAILKEHRDDIIADLNQDLLAEIDSLKQQITWMQESRRY